MVAIAEREMRQPEEESGTQVLFGELLDLRQRLPCQLGEAGAVLRRRPHARERRAAAGRVDALLCRLDGPRELALMQVADREMHVCTRIDRAQFSDALRLLQHPVEAPRVEQTAPAPARR